MAIFVETRYNTTNNTTILNFPAYLDPLVLTLILLLCAPGILTYPFILKSRIPDVANSIPALLTTCLSGVYFFLSLFFPATWGFYLMEEAPANDIFCRNMTTANQVYAFIFYNTNMYSSTLLYLAAFARYRAFSDPFNPVQYKEILRKVIGFGVWTLALCTSLAVLDANLMNPFCFSKFTQLPNTLNYGGISSFYQFINIFRFFFLVSCLEHSYRTVKLLRRTDDNVAVESREQCLRGERIMLPFVPFV